MPTNRRGLGRWLPDKKRLELDEEKELRLSKGKTVATPLRKKVKNARLGREETAEETKLREAPDRKKRTKENAAKFVPKGKK